MNVKRGSMGRNPLDWIKPTTFKTVIEEENMEWKQYSQKNVQEKECFLIPLSARTQTALRAKVNELTEWIKKHKDDVKIKDIAYTLSVGRSHFEYRSVWLAENLDELEQMFLDQEDEKQIGMNALSMSQSQKQLLQEKADALIKEMIEANGRNKSGCLAELKEYYEQGAQIDWRQLFSGIAVHKISLPGYPFERSSYWVENKKSCGYKKSCNGIHPMLDTNCSTFYKQAFFKTFNGQEFFLRDHCVGSERVLPGVAYLELARAAGEISNPDKKAVQMKNIVWYNPIHMKKDDKEYSIEIRLSLKNEQSIYEVFTVEDGKASLLNGEGTILFKDKLPEEKKKILDIEKWKAESHSVLSGKQCYQNFSKRNLNLGESFQSIQQLYRKGQELLGEIQLPESLAAGFEEYPLHPVIIDGALEAVIGLMLSGSDKEQELSLPFALDEITIYEKVDKACYSYVRKSSQPAEEGVDKFDAMILNAKGELLISLIGFSFKEVFRDQELKSDVGGFYYKPFWKQEVPKDITEKENFDAVLVVDSPEGEYECLEHGKSRYLYIKQPLGEEGLEEKLETLVEKSGGIRSIKVIYTAALSAESKQTGVIIFLLLKFLMRKKLRAHVLFAYCCERKDTPFQEGIAAILKTAVKENRKITYETVGLETDRSVLEIEQVLNCEQEENAEVRYISGSRYRKAYNMFIPSGKMSQKKVLTPDGVYLITGGIGKIGMVFARSIAALAGGTILLAGRSAVRQDMEGKLNELRKLGAKAEYIQVDVADFTEVQTMVQNIIRNYGKLSGIIHGAGTIKDGLILDKTRQTFQCVTEPKIEGMYNLEYAIKKHTLDFFILLSSIAAVNGNAGQADYAYANAVMDAYAIQNKDIHMVSVNWPLWENGGMTVDDDTKAYFKNRLGIYSLSDESGVRVFLQAIAMEENNFLYLEGEKHKFEKALGFVKSKERITSSSVQKDIRKVESDIQQIMKDILRVELSHIEPNKSLDDYGFNSLNYADFARKIQEKYDISITPADFYEFPTFQSLTQYLYNNFGEQIFSLTEEDVKEENNKNIGVISGNMENRTFKIIESEEKKQENVDGDYHEPIAIIGMSGIFPGSKDLEEFWKNLYEKKNLISEVPKNRWDWKAVETKENNTGKGISRWGGFIKGIDEFDSSFFGISAREANLMDPQHRLFLQTVWNTIEDSGYKPEDLSGSETGVFVGVSTQDYSETFMREQRQVEAYLALGTSRCILPNRISYLLNLKGPSMSIDTACSSSLVALHEAVRSIRSGECGMAIVGGVNVMIASTLHEAFSKSGMLAKDGKCKAFDESADGYVRGEGVGAILIKPLSQARKDRDPIYALIRGSAVNHNGKSNTLTSPSKKAQEEVLLKAYEDAGVDGTMVSYCEAHGTGTSLGDPIEINGLKAAFETMYQRKNKLWAIAEQRVAIGSVKTNVGHLEAASGIAGIIKVVLAMQHGIIPGTPHFHKINPYIDLKQTPFYIAKDTKSWKRLKDETGKELPRIAGISSFGFGGMNAHVVLEEDMYLREYNECSQEKYVVPVSAKTPEQLKVYCEELLNAVKQKENVKIPAQECMNQWREEVKNELRSVLEVSREELENSDNLFELGLDQFKLYQFRQMFQKRNPTLSWNENILADGTASSFLNQLQFGNTEKISGFESKEEKMPGEWRLCDFAYTMQEGRSGFSSRVAFVIHDFEELSKEVEHFLNGVSGNYYYNSCQELDKENKLMLPMSLEQTAENWCMGEKTDWSQLYQGGLPLRISLPAYPFKKERHWLPEQKNMVQSNWETKKVISDQKDSIEFCLTKKDLVMAHHKVNGKETLPGVIYLSLAYQKIASFQKDSIFGLKNIVWLQPCQKECSLHVILDNDNNVRIETQEENKAVVHALCSKDNTRSEAECIDIIMVEENASFQLNNRQVYKWFKETGIDYGTFFQSVQSVWDGGEECLSYLETPKEYEDIYNTFAWNPAVMDGALQTLAILHTGYQTQLKKIQLPYSIERAEYRKAIPKQAYAYVKRIKKDRYDVSILDLNGEICISLSEISVRTLKQETKPEPDFMYQPVWKPANVKCSKENKINGKIFILYADTSMGFQHAIAECFGENKIREIQIQTDNMNWLEDVTAEIKEQDTLFFLGGMEFENSRRDDEKELEKYQSQSVIAFYHMMQKFKQTCKKNIRVFVLTNYLCKVLETDVAGYYGAALAGFVLTAKKEFPEFTIHLFDLGVSIGKLAEQKRNLEYLCGLECTDTICAIRNGECYHSYLQKVKMPKMSKDVFQRGGVYVILGGTGGIGMELAAYLGIRYSAHVILISRSGIKEDKRKQYEELLAQGADIQIVRADITDYETLNRAVSMAEKEFGNINGFFHAAIVLRDQTICKMEEQNLKEVMEPKVEGVLVLKKVLENRKPDFIMFFSSIQSRIGNYGQANYSAASMFEDAFAISWNQVADFPVCVINWGFWGSVGIVSNDVYNKIMEEAGFVSIEPDEGIEVMQQVLAGGKEQIVAVKGTEKLLQEIGAGVQKVKPEIEKKEIQYILNWNKALEQYAQQKVLSRLHEQEMFLEEGEIYTLLQIKSVISPSMDNENVFRFLLSVLEREEYILIDDDLIVTTDKVVTDSGFKIAEYENNLMKTYPEIRPHVMLLKECMDHYGKLYHKEMEAVEVLFAGNRKKLVEDIYKGNKSVDYFNDLVSWSVDEYVKEKRKKNPEKSCIRILEAGSGTGATSKVVLDGISHADNVEYYFTDIGNSFIQEARKKYGEVYPFVRFELFDIEKDIEMQGYEKHSFDLVIAANVLHATKNMKNTMENIAYLLKTGGMVIVNELTEVTSFTTCTFGLLNGWWLMEDKDRRMPFSPLLSRELWKKLLLDSGFTNIQFYGAGSEDGILGQNVITGMLTEIADEENDKRKEELVPERKPEVQVKEQWSKYQIEKWMENKVTALVAQTIQEDFDTILVDRQFSDYGVDSINGLELIQRINEEFHIVLKTMVIFDYGNIRELSKFILEEFGEKIRQYRERKI